MLGSLAAIAGGGALGAVLRHSANQGAMHLFGPDYPYGTVFVNVLGSFIIGALIAYFAHVWQPSNALRLFVITGFLGAFTTFSTFSLDFVTLLERGAMAPAFGYATISVVLSIAGLMFGMSVIRWGFA